MSSSKGTTENRGLEYGVQHLTSPSQATTLLDLISELVPRPRAEELISLGSIYVEGRRCVDTQTLVRGQCRVRAHLEPRRYQMPASFEGLIVERTSDFIVVDKPAGIPVHALVDNVKENLLSALEELLKVKLFITHRLDVETSGMVAIALNSSTQQKINRAFAERKLKRSYVALVSKPVKPATLVSYLEPSPRTPKVMSETAHDRWQYCETRVTSCVPALVLGSQIETHQHAWIRHGSDEDIFALEIELVTGRTHQIRAQLAAAGNPVLGDRIYGSPSRLTDIKSGAVAIGLRAFSINLKQLLD